MAFEQRHDRGVAGEPSRGLGGERRPGLGFAASGAGVVAQGVGVDVHDDLEAIGAALRGAVGEQGVGHQHERVGAALGRSGRFRGSALAGALVRSVPGPGGGADGATAPVDFGGLAVVPAGRARACGFVAEGQAFLGGVQRGEHERAFLGRQSRAQQQRSVVVLVAS